MRMLRRRPPSPQLHGWNKSLSQLGILVLIIGYWHFAIWLERVDYVALPELLLRLGEFFFIFRPLLELLSPIIIPASNYLNWGVMRHFIPPLIGWWLARRAIVGMLQSFYDLPGEEASGSLLERMMANQATFYKPVPIFMKTFAEARKNEPFLRIGGPGRLNIPPGFAVVTEVNGRFGRVLGPGTRTLHRFEYPRTVVDIRPQERETDNVSMVTSDGIELTTSISVTFQVDKGKEKPTPDQPFPFDPEAVRQVAYSDTNQGEENIGSWESLALIITSGQLKDIVAEYRLDELILSDQNGIDIHRRLQLEMERRSRAVMRHFGVEIRGTRLGTLELPELVTDQRIRYWQSYWEKQRLLQMADGEAEILEMQVIARTEAEAIMLQAIVEGLQRAQRAGRDVSSREVVALRLIESLEGMAKQSEMMLPLPAQLMPQLNSIRRQLMLTSRAAEEQANQE